MHMYKQYISPFVYGEKEQKQKRQREPTYPVTMGEQLTPH